MSDLKYKYILLFLFIIKFIFLIQFCTEFHLLQNSDTLLHSIMSTHEITPYYWGQDQWLNLLPFLFSFVTNIEYNLMLITLFQFLIFFSLPLTFAKLYEIKKKYINAILFYIFTLLPTTKLYHINLITEPFTVAIALAFINLSILKIKSQLRFTRYLKNISFIALFIISYKVCQPVIFLYIVHFTLVSIKRFYEYKIKDILCVLKKKFFNIELLIFFILFLIAFWGIEIIHYSKSVGEVVQYRKMNIILSPKYAYNSAMQMLYNYGIIYEINKVHLVLFFISSIILLARIQKGIEDNFNPPVILLFSATINIILFSVLEWTELNSYHPRYIMYSSILFCLFSSVIISSTIILKFPDRYINRILLVSLLICLSITLIIHNPTKPIPLAKRLETEFLNKYNITIDDKNVDGAIGDYWSVWPAVWLNNAFGRKDYFGVSILRTRLSLIKKNKPLLLRHYGENNQLKHIVDRYFPQKDYSIINEKNVSYIKIYQ